jgi:lipoyl(octanoyl) transferase
MQRFTEQRDAVTQDEIWLVEHPPVFTLGLNGKPEHLLDPGDIPVVHCDRGGQVTYHGPGQVVIYLLLDLKRRNLGVKALVNKIEQAIIDLLAKHEIDGARRAGAPGIYVKDKKIAALGLRVRRGCCYHGLSLNTDMDLAPFSRINPCGYQGLQSTQISEMARSKVVFADIQQQLLSRLLMQLKT